MLRFLSRLSTVFMAISGRSIVTIIVMSITDALTEAITGRGLAISYDVVEIAMAYTIFLGLPEVFLRNANIRVDVSDYFLPRRVTRVLEVTGTLLILGFVMLLLAAMVMPAYDSTRFGDYKYETGFPYWGIWLPIFAGLIAAIPSALAAGGRKHVEP